MSFSYKVHRRGFAAAIALSVLLTASTLAGFGPWRIAALFPLAVGLLAVLLWTSGSQKARRLGSVVLDADAVRRVRGDGRVIAALPWRELRRVVVDRRRRMLLLEGRGARTVWCHGPALVGGVGVERFDALLEEIGKRTALPLTPVTPRWQRRSRPFSVTRQGA